MSHFTRTPAGQVTAGMQIIARAEANYTVLRVETWAVGDRTMVELTFGIKGVAHGSMILRADEEVTARAMGA